MFHIFTGISLVEIKNFEVLLKIYQRLLIIKLSCFKVLYFFFSKDYSFHRNILKNVYKKVTSHFYRYSLMPNSEPQKEIDKNLGFSTENVAKRLNKG